MKTISYFLVLYPALFQQRGLHEFPFNHVSDTAFWVAHYRAIESERPDSLFKDPYAQVLVGEYASEIAKIASDTTRWTQWTVVMRTYIIDQMVRLLISKGLTTFLNIGSGLDCLPYRMNLGQDIY